MQKQVYDRFPIGLRATGFLICAAIGAVLIAAVPDTPFFSLLLFVPGLIMLSWINVLRLSYDGRTWRYQSGIWPIVKRRAGSFDDLNAIEVGVHLYQATDQYGNTIDDAPSSNTYTAYLTFKDPSIGPQRVITGRSFGEAARPAAAMAHRMRIPITLAPSGRGYDTQLSEYISLAQGDGGL